MMRLPIALLVASAAAPVMAQHEDREPQTTPPPAAQAPADPHAGHEPRADAPSAADPHTGHDADGAQRGPEPADAGPDAHAAHDASGMLDRTVLETPPPAAAFSGAAHAADGFFDPGEMAEARELLRAEQGATTTYLALADRLETRRANAGETQYAWDVQAWYGGDITKLWLKSEGDGGSGDNPEDAEVQALYSRAVTPFFDLQAGVRYDFPGESRSHWVLGIEGLLPFVFELDAAAFWSDDGDLTGRVEAEYDVRITQRFVLQPRIEVNFAAQAVPELGVGSGVGSVEGGLRLRYEVRRELAPYIGISWERKRGNTGDFARAIGDGRRSRAVVVGLRSWF